MGERKGQNKYYPPDYDPKKGGLNKFQGTHALRERARKIHLGIIIIRFEMPYNIWCDGCKNHIGMGVRYNAEKTKVGMYYTTPIYKFRMKCHLCDNHFEIQTDPGNLDYVILTGARRQENRWDPLQNEQVVPETKEVQKRLFDDAMYKLEHQAMDVKAAADSKPVLQKLVERNQSVWDDSYVANYRLRASFRQQKQEIKGQQDLDRLLLAKSSLDIALLPETAQDREMAALMKLQTRSAIERESEQRLELLMRPALPGATTTTFGGLKRQKALNTQLQLQDLGIKRKAAGGAVLGADGAAAMKAVGGEMEAAGGAVKAAAADKEAAGAETPLAGGDLEAAEGAAMKVAGETPAVARGSAIEAGREMEAPREGKDSPVAAGAASSAAVKPFSLVGDYPSSSSEDSSPDSND